jgi:hypothetical protein
MKNNTNFLNFKLDRRCYFDAWPETMEETFGEVIENLKCDRSLAARQTDAR